VRVHFAGEHALEFQLLDMGGKCIDVAGDCDCRTFVVFRFGELKQFVGAGQAVAESAYAVDDAVKRRPLLAELLRAPGVVPDVRIFELAGYFLEPFAPGVVVKDTP
jgi:hypothetical protein